MVELQLLKEKNKLYFPGEMLYRFRQEDLRSISIIKDIGVVKIKNNEIHFTPKKGKDVEFYRPYSWVFMKRTKSKFVFKVP